MLGFSPLASAPLADTGAVAEAGFGLDDIVAGAPTVDAAAISQSHALTSVEIATSAPVVDASGITQGHVIVAQNITAGIPVVDPATHVTNFSLAANDITTGNPSVDSASISEFIALTANDISTNNPIIDASNITQTHLLTSNSVTSSTPLIDQPVLNTLSDLTSTDITTNSPLIDSPSISQNHTFREHIDGRIEVGVSSGQFTLQDYKVNVGNIGPLFNSLELHTGRLGGTHTYTFSFSGSNYSGHDFRLRTLDGVSYTDGVTLYHPPDYEDRLELVLAYDAPEYLQYYCLNHSSMVGDLFIRKSPSAEAVGLDTQIITDPVSINEPSLVENPLTANNITTNTPEVDQASLIENYQFTSDDIVTSPPVIDSPDYFIQLTANHITTNAVQIDIPTANEGHECVAISITTGLPVIDQSTILDVSPLINPDIDGANDLITLTQANEVYISIDVSDAIIDEEVVLANVA